MAIERNFTGFEMADLGELNYGSGGVLSGARNTVPSDGTARSGSRYYRSDAATNAGNLAYFPAGSIVGTSGTVTSGNHKRVSVRAFLRIEATSNNGQIRVLGFGDDAGTCTVQFGAQNSSGGFTQPGSKIGLRIGSQSHNSGAVGAYPWGSVDLSLNVWYRFLLDIDLDVGATTVLSATLRVTEDSDSPSVDFTLTNSTNIGATDNIDKLAFGYSNATIGGARLVTCNFDDVVYIATSDSDAVSGQPALPSQTHIYAIIPPTGIATNTGWSGSYTDVDEYPASGSDTMSSSTASAEVDFSHATGIALGYSQITAMKAYLNALVSGAGTGAVNYLLNGTAKSVTLGVNYPVSVAADPVGGVLFSTMTPAQFSATTFGLQKQNGTQSTLLANIGLEVIGTLASSGAGSNQVRGETQIKPGSIYDAQIADTAGIKRHKIQGLSDGPTPVFLHEDSVEETLIFAPTAQAKAAAPPIAPPVFFPEDLHDETPMRPSGSSSSGGGDIKSDGSVAFAADQSMGSHKLTNVTDPGSAQDAATKAYVDSAISGGGGKVVQVVNTETGAVASGSTVIPFDNTIPQSTEGDQYMSLSVTPVSSTNKLKIEVVVFATVTSTPWIIVGLFQDSGANAIACAASFNNLSTAGMTIAFTHYMAAGTTSATTFKVRIGPSSAATITFNGQSGARIFGGALASSITITEIVP